SHKPGEANQATLLGEQPDPRPVAARLESVHHVIRSEMPSVQGTLNAVWCENNCRKTGKHPAQRYRRAERSFATVFEHVQRDGVRKGKVSAAGRGKVNEMTAGAEPISQIARERADVEASRATYAQSDRALVDIQEIDLRRHDDRGW